MKTLFVAGDRASDVALARYLARELAAADRATSVLVAARGEGATRVERTDGGARIVRADAAPDHWQRSRSAAVAALMRALIREEAPDLVHVLSWRGLTHDLVALAAEQGVRAVVTLAEPWFACLVGDRVRRDVAEAGACAAPLGPMPCLACADRAHGPTPWVPIEARYMAVAERRRDALRELRLARRVVVADEASADAARRALSDPLADVEFAFAADPRDAARIASIHADARRSPAPASAAKAPDWWVERMESEAERAWDDSRARALEGTR